VLAGFDFPIGLPLSYGLRTGCASFRETLSALGSGRWRRFYDVANRPNEISIERPFYPKLSNGMPRQKHLCDAHGVEAMDELRRRCELRTCDRRAACPLFWTLGPNQVGKGAITGWQEIIVPAIACGARLWPFDGGLGDLARAPGLAIAETYPAEAYRHVGVAFRAGESKRCAMDRIRHGPAIFEWAQGRGVSFDPAIKQLIDDGFGDDGTGEDRFDALVGLLGMIEVVLGRRSDGAPNDDEIRLWEGWILGQRSQCRSTAALG